ncbi:MAG TPA: DsbA family protein [Methylovirgula sp.]|nr:DsbA family protein [Methylovirgula sp.]
MKRMLIFALAPIAACFFATCGFAQNSQEDIDAAIHDYLVRHPDEIGAIARDYLLKNPDVLKEMFAELMRRRSLAQAKRTMGVDDGAAITNNAAALFFSPHEVSLGDPTGDVTLVEFFDYNCHFCRRALPDMLALLQSEPKLRIVLKEFPILGQASADAARVAIAVRMQDPAKYLAVHRELLGAPGLVNKDRALAAAKDAGLDMEQLQRDLASDEVNATLAENFKLASALGIRGTPGYVVGYRVVQGAIGAAALTAVIEAQRRPRAD